MWTQEQFQEKLDQLRDALHKFEERKLKKEKQNNSAVLFDGLFDDIEQQ